MGKNVSTDYIDFFPDIWDKLEDVELAIRNLKEELKSDSTYNSCRAYHSIIRNFDIICINFDNLESSIDNMKNEWYVDHSY